MTIDINLLAVLGAALTSVCVGMVWYHPRVFGTRWMRLANVAPTVVEAGAKNMAAMAFIGFVASVFTAFVLAHFAVVWSVVDVFGAIELAFWVWLGYMVPITLGSFLWEGKSFMLVLINAGYWLIAVTAMTLIVALL